MSTFCDNIKKLIGKLPIDSEDIKYISTGNIHEDVIQARLNNLYKDFEDYSIFLNLCDLDRRYYKITLQVKTQNNTKVKNIESVMTFIRLFETQFVYIDKIKLYQMDGVIFVDIYRDSID